MKNMCKEDLMKIITQASFAMDDTRLFLDTHPNCVEAIDFHKKMEKIRQEAWKEYTEKFGPLSFYDTGDSEYWEWNKGPMPWEGGNC